MVTKTQIAKKLGIHLATVSKILNKVPEHRASERTVQRVFKVALEMGYDFSDMKYFHKRKHIRKEISIDTKIRYELKGSLILINGIARNISEGGILINSMFPQPEFVPTHSNIEVFLVKGPLAGRWIECEFVRHNHNEVGIELGLRFIYDCESERRDVKQYVGAV